MRNKLHRRQQRVDKKYTWQSRAGFRASWGYSSPKMGWQRPSVEILSPPGFRKKQEIAPRVFLFLSGCTENHDNFSLYQFSSAYSSPTMEEIMEAVNNMNIGVDSHKKNRIQVSNRKKHLFFYVNLAKVI